MTKQYLRELFNRMGRDSVICFRFVRAKDSDLPSGERSWKFYRGKTYLFTVWESEIVPSPF